MAGSGGLGLKERLSPQPKSDGAGLWGQGRWTLGAHLWGLDPGRRRRTVLSARGEGTFWSLAAGVPPPTSLQKPDSVPTH